MSATEIADSGNVTNTIGAFQPRQCQSLRIAYFINHYPKVSHSFVRREILALERQGFTVQRIALRGWLDSLPDEEDHQEQKRTHYVLREGLRGLLLPMVRTMLRTPSRFFAVVALGVKMSRNSDRPLPYHLIYVAEACRILEWLVAFGSIRLHAHFGTNSAEVAMFTHALGGPPYSFTVHGPDEFLRPIGLEEKIRRSSFVVAISNFGRSQLFLRSRHADWPKIKIVHCGLEESFYQAAPQTLGPPRLICVGRLCDAKGQILLIEAAALLADKGISFELVLAGDGPMRKEIERIVQERGLGERVRITGWISSNQVRDEILAARALVLPSFAEGLPVVIMEAMALRRPVLSTYVAGIPELVRHGQEGWLVPAGAVRELAEAMEACLASSVDDLRRLGDAAQSRVLVRHSVDTETGKLAELFRVPDRE
jgi:colanic acid/amylovoran biosynthesis glycosyltransferase